jgi:hypothetical protein
MCCVLVEVRYGVRRSIARMSAHTGQLAVPRDITVPCIFHHDDPFIVLTETKFSFRCIPVGIGTLLTELGSTKKHM